MLICITLRLIASQSSMTRNSPILRSISTGSSAANIAAGFGNGSMPGIMPPIIAVQSQRRTRRRCCTGGAAARRERRQRRSASRRRRSSPASASANGFHIFCMNAIASWRKTACVPPAGLLVSSLIDPPCRTHATCDTSDALARCANIVRHGEPRRNLARSAGEHRRRGQRADDCRPTSSLTSSTGAAAITARRARSCARRAPPKSRPSSRCAPTRDVPIVPQGGNTGMCGGATPDESGSEVVVSLARMRAVRARRSRPTRRSPSKPA